MSIRSLSSMFALLAATSVASAQDAFRLERLQPPPTVEDGLALQLPGTLGHLRPAFRMQLGYARLPLQTTDAAGGVEVIGHQLSADVAAALGLGDRVELFVNMPVVLHQRGDELAGSGLRDPSSAGLSDLRLGASVRIAGDLLGPSMGARASLLLPTGRKEALATDDGVGVEGALLMAYGFRPLLLALELGGAYRPHRESPLFETAAEVTFRAGVHVPVRTRVKLLAELDGSARAWNGQLFEAHTVPVEALLGARLAAGSGVVVGVAGALGLTDAPAVPAARGLFTVGWAPAQVHLAPTPIPPADSARDSFPDDSDACPRQFGTEQGCPLAPPPPPTPPEPAGVPQPAPEPVPAEPEQDPYATRALSDAIRFDYNSAKLSNERVPLLRRVRKLLKEDHGLRVRLIGHASDLDRDESFSPELRARRNQDLSVLRARAVERWLLRHDIDAARIHVEGRGANEPVAPNDSDDNRQRNRRVEIRADE